MLPSGLTPAFGEVLGKEYGFGLVGPTMLSLPLSRLLDLF